MHEPDIYDHDPNASVEEDNWLVSYADLLTNLLAFFVLLFSISSVQSLRWEMVSRTFSKDKPPRMGMHELKRKVDVFIAENELERDLETQLDESGLQLRFKTKLLFDSASADLSAGGAALLSPVGEMLRSLDERYEVVVEGHADDQPIHTTAFDSNWELSAKRSVNVVRRLIDDGVRQEAISAQAFSNTRPIKSSAPIEELRAGNRRVVVRVR